MLLERRIGAADTSVDLSVLVPAAAGARGIDNDGRASRRGSASRPAPRAQRRGLGRRRGVRTSPHFARAPRASYGGSSLTLRLTRATRLLTSRARRVLPAVFLIADDPVAELDVCRRCPRGRGRGGRVELGGGGRS